MSEQSKKTVQQKLSELSELVAWFQSPGFKLEDAVTKFKTAEALAEEIEKDLTKLKNDITVVKKKFDSEA
ncbi:MAG: exodeoxyribonuclease VII small subunit [Candidatus Saccharimonadota bacterium]|jgi:exodeoxyribonuclease VII small subunit